MAITRKMFMQRFSPVSLFLLFAVLMSSVVQSCSDNSNNPPANNPPTAPTLLEPADGAVATPTAVTLVWQAATDPENDSVAYELYFDDANPPSSLAVADIDSNSFNLLHLSQGTTYFWNVTALDRKGAHSEPSAIWQFTVGSFEYGWSELSSMPTSRLGAASAVAGNKLYVFGGNSYHGTLNISESYDPSNNWWEQLAEMPSRRAYSAAVEHDGIIYVIGGEFAGTPQALLESYNPSSDTWLQLEPMPDARTRCAAVALNGKIYVFGGFEAPTAILVYDIALNQWDSSGSLPEQRYGMSITNVNGLFYIIGGSQPNNLYLKDITKYDPSTGVFSPRSSMPSVRQAHRADHIGNKIYVTGGYNVISGIHTYFSSVEVYDIPSNSWITRSRMEYARHDHSSGVINGKIYVAGGVTDRLPDILNSLEVYNPQLDQ